MTNHFTALVWSSVTRMGCAFNANKRLAICRYAARTDDFNNGVPNTYGPENFENHVHPLTFERDECEMGQVSLLRGHRAITIERRPERAPAEREPQSREEALSEGEEAAREAEAEVAAAMKALSARALVDAHRAAEEQRTGNWAAGTEAARKAEATVAAAKKALSVGARAEAARAAANWAEAEAEVARAAEVVTRGGSHTLGALLPPSEAQQEDARVSSSEGGGGGGHHHWRSSEGDI